MNQNSSDIRIEPYPSDDALVAMVLADGAGRVRVSRFSSTGGKPAAVLGRSGRPEVELDVEAVMRSGVDIFRRKGGGCAVLLDSGTVVVSIAEALPGLGDVNKILLGYCRGLVDSLLAIGIAGITLEGISDLAFGGRKVAGTCLYRSKNIALFSACILVDADIPLMELCLRHPPREPAYRRGRNHGEFVATLSETHGLRDIDGLVVALEKALTASGSLISA